MNKTKKFTYFLSLFIVFIFLGVSFKGDDDIYDKINRNMEVFGKVFKEIALNYVDEIELDKFTKEGIDGMLKTLDPYTNYIDQNAKGEVDLIVNGKYGGIGVTISLKDSSIYIINVMSGYEAQRKGLRAGDKILNIDGTDLKGLSTSKVNNLVRGQAGTNLIMTVERDNQILNFDLTRQEIILKNISYSGFINNQDVSIEDGIAYFKLERFTSIAETEVENTIKKLQSEGTIKGLIIDLRDNGGGLLEASTGILEKIVKRNSLLVITKGRKKDSEIKYFSKEDPLIDKDIPIVMLVNGNTASASEIMSGAVQDLDRGVIIGSKTFGKGLVQNIKDIEGDAKLKITISRYYTPSGRWIQSKNYFKENKFGVFLNQNVFTQTEFKTLNGRTVFANGGITPDIEINVAPESEIHSALLLKDMFFKYSNYYLEQNPETKVFKSTERTFEDFKNFILSKDFIYRSEAMKKIEELKSLAEKKGYSADFTKHLDLLNADAENNYEKELTDAKEEILKSLEAEINKRIITENEQFEALMSYDKQLSEAIRILKNTGEYKTILNLF